VELVNVEVKREREREEMMQQVSKDEIELNASRNKRFEQTNGR
jgi:hypothetical protein